MSASGIHSYNAPLASGKFSPRAGQWHEPNTQSSSGGKPHICFVAPEAWPVFSGDPNIEVIGGAEVQQSILARLLASAGYPVSMICFDYGQPRRVVMDGVTLIATHGMNDGIPVLRFIHPRITRMWQAMAQVNADIYYQRSAAMLTAVVAAFCRHHGKRSIYAGASDSDFVPGQQMIRFRRDRWLFEQGLAAVDTVLVQNQKQQQDCLQHYGRESTLIPSCYALQDPERLREGDVVLWVSTLRPTKRPELFLEMARRLSHLHFVMIGGPAASDPGGEARYATTREEAARIPNMEFKGFLPLAQVEPWFDRARVVVNTSYFEGMPNVFLQAWARGVPTLAFSDTGSRLDGAPVYPVVNQVDEAVREIERLFPDGPYREQASARCREYFTRTHGTDHVLQQYMGVLDELVARSQ